MKIELKKFEKSDFKIDVSHFRLGNPDGVVVVFPGAGYSHMGPCLYYPSNFFLDNNYEVINFEYDFRQQRLKDESQESFREYFDFLLGILEELEIHPNRIALSKSIGTRILGSRDTNFFKQKIWLTPALKNQFVVDSILNSKSNSLVVIGTADPFYKKDVIKDIKSHDVHYFEILGADHGLDIDGDILKTLNEMKNIVSCIKDFIHES